MSDNPASLIFAKITYMEDTRNVIDKFKGRSETEIVKEKLIEMMHLNETLYSYVSVSIYITVIVMLFIYCVPL